MVSSSSSSVFDSDGVDEGMAFGPLEEVSSAGGDSSWMLGLGAEEGSVFGSLDEVLSAGGDSS